jgi:transcriptional regulator with XRE-family HTH domain
MRLDVYLSLHDLSVAEFAKSVGMTRQGVHLLVRGKRRPRLETLQKIAAVTSGKVGVQDFYPDNR